MIIALEEGIWRPVGASSKCGITRSYPFLRSVFYRLFYNGKVWLLQWGKMTVRDKIDILSWKSHPTDVREACGYGQCWVWPWTNKRDTKDWCTRRNCNTPKKAFNKQINMTNWDAGKNKKNDQAAGLTEMGGGHAWW